ncbi:MAG: hypothetical protein PHF97_06385 [Bacteroidales bacterium]|nr:hypothetical protein [Bacteroidales bacterium]
MAVNSLLNFGFSHFFNGAADLKGFFEMKIKAGTASSGNGGSNTR